MYEQNQSPSAYPRVDLTLDEHIEPKARKFTNNESYSYCIDSLKLPLSICKSSRLVKIQRTKIFLDPPTGVKCNRK